jgi:hypothetical protein
MYIKNDNLQQYRLCRAKQHSDFNSQKSILCGAKKNIGNELV